MNTFNAGAHGFDVEEEPHPPHRQRVVYVRCELRTRVRGVACLRKLPLRNPSSWGLQVLWRLGKLWFCYFYFSFL